MLEIIHLEINNGETNDNKLAIHVIGLKATHNWALTVQFENNADGCSWHEEGLVSGTPTNSGDFWLDMTEGAIYGMVENWTRDTDKTPDDFLAAHENAWMNGFTASDFAPENWNDATKL